MYDEIQICSFKFIHLKGVRSKVSFNYSSYVKHKFCYEIFRAHFLRIINFKNRCEK